MTITARYPSRCAACHQPIAAGDRIEWTKGQQARHQACAAQPSASVRGASYRAGIVAPGRQTCPHCGSRECARAWDHTALCDED